MSSSPMLMPISVAYAVVATSTSYWWVASLKRAMYRAWNSFCYVYYECKIELGNRRWLFPVTVVYACFSWSWAVFVRTKRAVVERVEQSSWEVIAKWVTGFIVAALISRRLYVFATKDRTVCTCTLASCPRKHIVTKESYKEKITSMYEWMDVCALTIMAPMFLYMSARDLKNFWFKVKEFLRVMRMTLGAGHFISHLFAPGAPDILADATDRVQGIVSVAEVESMLMDEYPHNSSTEHVSNFRHDMLAAKDTIHGLASKIIMRAPQRSEVETLINESITYEEYVVWCNSRVRNQVADEAKYAENITRDVSERMDESAEQAPWFKRYSTVILIGVLVVVCSLVIWWYKSTHVVSKDGDRAALVPPAPPVSDTIRNTHPAAAVVAAEGTKAQIAEGSRNVQYKLEPTRDPAILDPTITTHMREVTKVNGVWMMGDTTYTQQSRHIVQPLCDEMLITGKCTAEMCQLQHPDEEDMEKIRVSALPFWKKMVNKVVRFEGARICQTQYQTGKCAGQADGTCKEPHIKGTWKQPCPKGRKCQDKECYLFHPRPRVAEGKGKNKGKYQMYKEEKHDRILKQREKQGQQGNWNDKDYVFDKQRNEYVERDQPMMIGGGKMKGGGTGMMAESGLGKPVPPAMRQAAIVHVKGFSRVNGVVAHGAIWCNKHAFWPDKDRLDGPPSCVGDLTVKDGIHAGGKTYSLDGCIFQFGDGDYVRITYPKAAEEYLKTIDGWKFAAPEDAGQPVWLATLHPFDMSLRVSQGTTGVATRAHLVAHDCWTTDGYCGSPVINVKGQVIGIHAATDKTTNYFVPWNSDWNSVKTYKGPVVEPASLNSNVPGQ